MSDEPIIEGEVMDEPGTGVALRAASTDVGRIVAGRSPAEIVDAAGQIAATLKELIERQNLSKNVGGNKKHVEVGGWQAAGTMLGALGGQPLHAETLWTRRVADEHGKPEVTAYTQVTKKYRWENGNKILASETFADIDGFSYEAKVQVCTPDGTVVGSAEAMCSRSENTWSTRDDFALRSMAETRAESRAYRRAIGWIMNVAGYSATPAEEMAQNEPTAPPFGGAASKDAKRVAVDSVLSLLGAEGTRDDAVAFLSSIAVKAGYMPEVVTGVLRELAALHVSIYAPPDTQPTPTGEDFSDAATTAALSEAS